jgi:ABC-2 type transport system permease protein
VFVGVAATTAQVASSARAATAGAGAVLGVSFIMRAVGDLGTGWMTWLSPLGWAQSIRAFADERWWVLVPIGFTALALIGSGVVLSSRRDLGAGLLRQRPGPEEGSTRLATPLAMAVRQQRTSLISWTSGVAFIGFFFGIVADQADELLENEAIAEIYARAGVGTPTEAFFATGVLMVALIASGFTISTVLRLRTEETAGRAAATMATPVSRYRWMSSYLIVSMLGTVVVMVVSGLAMGIGYGLQLGDTELLLPVLGAALAIVPALLVLSAFAVALIGLRPGLASLAWLGLVVSATVGLLAETLDLPQWSRNVSPFEHVPALPAASLQVLPLVVLSLVALGLVAFGMATMHRRDVE